MLMVLAIRKGRMPATSVVARDAHVKTSRAQDEVHDEVELREEDEDQDEELQEEGQGQEEQERVGFRQ
eukprot:12149956-Heterocapsa_arctica.AAC.2